MEEKKAEKTLRELIVEREIVVLNKINELLKEENMTLEVSMKANTLGNTFEIGVRYIG